LEWERANGNNKELGGVRSACKIEWEGHKSAREMEDVDYDAICHDCEWNGRVPFGFGGDDMAKVKGAS
jgi:hypothetical protein